MIGKKRKLVAGAILAVVAAIVAAILGANRASAAPMITFHDSSITAYQTSQDAISSVGAKFDTTSLNATGNTVVGTPGTPIGGSHTITFQSTGGSGPITWSTTETNFGGGWNFSLTGNVLTVTAPTVVAPLVPSALPTIVAKATDGTAVAFDTLVVNNGTVITAPPGPNVGKVDTVTLAQTPDTVVVNHPFNNNSTGQVDYSTTPPGATLTLSNAAAGVTLTAGVLSATDAVPGKYFGVLVTAKDTMGAMAVQRNLNIVVGFKVKAILPHLYGGHAVQINSVREWVYFFQGGAESCDYFTIVGPGGINGHHGWVPGHLGLNRAWYAGLLPGHTYTVFFQPVGTIGSSSCAGAPTTPIPGTHGGHVTFVS